MFLEAAGNTPGGSLVGGTLLYIIFFGALIYFMMIRPQKKQQKQIQEVQDSLAPGDNIMTTGGFYGTVLDIVDDTIIVEFGNNKNCRIPMHKNAIAEVEKANTGTKEDTVEEKKDKKEKK